MSWMSKFLDSVEEEKVEKLIGDFESSTGAELVLCINKASDPYPGAGLRFALLATFTFSAFSTLIFSFGHPIFCLIQQIPEFFLFATIGKLSSIRKLFLAQKETNREVREKALELFEASNICQTKDHSGLLILVSILERKIEIVADEKIFSKFGQENLDNLTNSLTKYLIKKDNYEGIKNLLKSLDEKILHFFPEKVQEKKQNEISNKIIWGDYSS